MLTTLFRLNARSSLRGMYSSESRGGMSIQFEDLSASPSRRAELSVEDPHKVRCSHANTDLGRGMLKSLQTSRPRVIECRVDIDVDSNEDQRKVSFLPKYRGRASAENLIIERLD